MIEVGKKYNNWTVIESAGKDNKGNGLWRCICKCGNEQIKNTGYLNCVDRDRNYNGCRICAQGNRNQEEDRLIGDLIGKRVGDWIVCSLAGKNKYKSRMWLCRCKCGNERNFNTSYLTGTGKRQATKCQKCMLMEMESKNRITDELPNRFWNKFLHVAKRRDKEVSITQQQAFERFKAQNGRCALTGLELCFTKLRTNYSRYTSASIDRIDSDKPYAIDNIQWVDKRINMMKQRYGQEEFIELCKLVAANNLMDRRHEVKK